MLKLPSSQKRTLEDLPVTKPYHHDSAGARRQFEQAVQAVLDILPAPQPELAERIAIAVLTSVRLPQVSIALEDAVKLIEAWHCMGMRAGAEGEEAWKIYREKSPEMQSINLALKVIRGE